MPHGFPTVFTKITNIVLTALDFVVAFQADTPKGPAVVVRRH